jgi:hypothetical protein
MTKNMIMSEVDSEIKQYQESFNKLKLDLQQHAVIHTEITVIRTENTVLRVLDAVGDLCEFPQ